MDYVGSYLVPVLVVAVALGYTSARAKIVAWITAAVLLLAILMSSVTAIFAAVAALCLLLLLYSPRHALIGTVVVGILSIAVISTYAPMRSRVKTIRSMAAQHDYDAMLTSRLTAFAAAWEMARSHPVAGVGPGCFAPNYFKYKLGAERQHPALLLSYSRTFNFSEVHNDHLQILAENGIVGYVLFAAVLVLVSCQSFRGLAPHRIGSDDRRKFVHLAALPLATAFAVLAMAQFPLRLPASLLTFVFIAAVIAAWSGRR